MRKEIAIDQTTTPIFGFQRIVNGYALEAILHGIDAGDQFPPVPIRRRAEDESTYVLDDSVYVKVVHRGAWHKLDGGHHRLVAHNKRGSPIRCSYDECQEPVAGVVIHPKDIKIQRGTGAWQEYKEARRRDNKYRSVFSFHGLYSGF